MKKSFWFLFACLALLAVLLAACGGAASTQPTEASANSASGAVSYAKDIQPIFNDNCAGCHGGAGGLTLTSYDSVMAGGRSGKVIVAGDSTNSLLYKRITGVIQPSMPKGGAPLNQDLIDLISKWIKEGAANN